MPGHALRTVPDRAHPVPGTRGILGEGLERVVGEGAVEPPVEVSVVAVLDVAAAGGDRGAANLRDRLNRRFGDDPAWREAAARAESEALQIWNSGIGEAIANRAK